MSEQKPERLRILRDHAGAFAIAFALFFGAGAFGFNSSPAFAALFITLIGCMILVAFIALIAAGSKGSDWLAGIIVLGLSVFTFYFFLEGIGQSSRLLHKASESAAAPDNSTAP